jgi:hypothetical protein
VLSVSVAWAGAGLVPVGDLAKDAAGKTDATASTLSSDPVSGDPASEGNQSPELVLQGGEVLAGASKISMEPRPDDYGGTWEKDPAKCETFPPSDFSSGDHIASTGSPWNENPDCIYMGGFGIGPANSVSSWDQTYGLWVRSFAVKGPNGKTLSLTILDGEGYLWDYNHKCTDCGLKQIAASVASDPTLGLEKEGIVIAATHSHSAPDFLGGWGFVPDWYMTQIKETIKQAITEAVTSMQPAVLEVGEVTAREENHERRDTYRAAEEQNLTWLRAVSTHAPGNPEVIATIGTYAAHPTNNGTNGGKASSDWVGPFEKRVEDRFGGVALYFMTGLGNMSSSGFWIGEALANLIPEVGGGTTLQNTNVSYAQTTWVHPATNVPLTALGVPGFFDRKFVNQPSHIEVGESETSPCVSASPVSVEMAATGARIGDQFALSAAPGEIFSSISNSIKERSDALVTMPIAQANDALGYMPQSMEINPVGQQGLGFTDLTGSLFINYEDSYAVDRCLGDAVQEKIIGMLGSL